MRQPPPGYDYESSEREFPRRITADWYREALLWLVLDEEAAQPRSLPEVTRLAIMGGVDAVLCRLKSQSAEQVYALAREVREICLEMGCPFVMSHHAAMAVHLGAEGLQLGRGDISLAAARELAGQGIALGWSSHSLAEARAAFAAGADYVFLGPVFHTPSKASYGPPLGLEAVREASSAGLPGPLVCIGGIDFQNLDELLAAGARQVAAIRALQATDEPASACWSMRSSMKMALPPAG